MLPNFKFDCKYFALVHIQETFKHLLTEAMARDLFKKIFNVALKVLLVFKCVYVCVLCMCFCKAAVNSLHSIVFFFTILG